MAQKNTFAGGPRCDLTRSRTQFKRPHGDDASKTYQTATSPQRGEINGNLDPIPGRGGPGLHDDDLPPNTDVLLYKGDTT